MDAAERARMEAKGDAVVDDAADWLGLDEVERKLVDFRVRIGREVRRRRERAGLSQAELATAIGSSQSQIAKADGIGLDLLMRAFFAAGGRIEVIAEESPDAPDLTPIQRTLQAIAQEIKTMTVEEFRASLVRAGIVTEDGELTAPYKPSPKKRSPRKPSPARSGEGDPGDR